MTLIGMRGGYWDGSGPPDGAPRAWSAVLDRAAAEAAESGKISVLEEAMDDATLVVAVSPASEGGYAWAGYPLFPPTMSGNFRAIGLTLAAAAAVLVASMLFTVVSIQRSAHSLSASLVALRGDLAAPIARPKLRELREVAEGIKKLADTLAESKREEERLSRELFERERLAGLGRVVAGVAHEVRNPLASIKLRLDLASQAPDLAKPVQTALLNASSEISRLDRLVADLLVVAGRGVGPKRDTELGRLVRARAEAASPFSTDRQVRVEVTGEATLAIDADSLTRTIDNLLKNAIEASPSGSTVRIAIRAEEERVRLSFEDQGAGVAADRVAQLFEPFFTTKSSGTGLGLAISRSIARAHGGDIQYSRDGAVTRFELTLPGRASDRRAAEVAA
jgi:signal transduction histidine kinase